MAKEKGMIVVKKITISGGGHHGGSWKVALADFMTAMMAFFLVMWLLNASEQTKKAVSDYFSTPSLIEYNFQNFGAEVTLEKLFLDLVNEPMKAFQSFMEPMDKTPDLLDMGSAKVVTAYIADQLNDFAKNVNVTSDGFDLDLPDTVLFERGTARPIKKFVEVMDRIKAITTGLKDAEIKVTSALFVQAVPESTLEAATLVADERLSLVTKKIQAGLEHTSVQVIGDSQVKEKKGEVDPSKLIGFIKIRVHQKPLNENSKDRRKLETVFGTPQMDMNVYQNFVNQITKSKPKKDPASARTGSDLKKAVEEDLRQDLPTPLDETKEE